MTEPAPIEVSTRYANDPRGHVMTAASNSTARKRDAEAAAMAEEAAAGIHQRPASGEVDPSATAALAGRESAESVVARNQGVEYAIENGWLVEVVNQHTCGAGPGSYAGMHEPGCGLVPLSRIEDLLRALAELDRLTATLARVEAWMLAECGLPYCDADPDSECGVGRLAAALAGEDVAP